MGPQRMSAVADMRAPISGDPRSDARGRQQVTTTMTENPQPTAGELRILAELEKKVLWLASWTRESPAVPAHNWGGHGWTFWQHGACGHIPGIRKCVDMDRFRGRDLGSVRIPTGLASTGDDVLGHLDLVAV